MNKLRLYSDNLRVSLYKQIQLCKRYLQIQKKVKKAQIFRSARNMARNHLRLQTPMDTVMFFLRHKNFLRNYKALELFGWHGLNITVDYAPFCESIDFYEVDPMIVKVVRNIHKKKYRNINVVMGDSIKLIQDEKMGGDYDLIVIDSSDGTYGNGYCEHFDIFPEVFKSLSKEGIIICGVIINARGFTITKEWIERRKDFYNVDDGYLLNPDKLLKFYKALVPGGQFMIRDAFYIPRRSNMGFIVLVLNRK